MRDLYPGYDVLSKRNTPSWNEQTRDVIDRRTAIRPDEHRFFSDGEWLTLCALCDCIVPQTAGREPIPVAALVDEKLHVNRQDGYRFAKLPPMHEAWRNGLAALDAEARQHHGRNFRELEAQQKSELLARVSRGEVTSSAWEEIPAKSFFEHRVLNDVVSAYYSHPRAWNEIGWGGPASPRGYVRMDFNRRDPWEAAEAKPGKEDEARRENLRVGR